MTVSPHHSYVLSVYLLGTGFAFAVFEGPVSPYDWGIKQFRSKDKLTPTLAGIAELIERYQPEAVVIEDFGARSSKRNDAVRKRGRAVADLVQREYVDFFRYSRAQIQELFDTVGASTKHEIAHAIGREIPSVAHLVPKKRKIWQSSDPQMGLFDAMALLAVYYRENPGLSVIDDDNSIA